MLPFILLLDGDEALCLAACGSTYINNIYGRGTAAMMLHAALLWTHTSLYSTRVRAAFHTAVSVDAALLLLLVHVLPFTLL